MRITTLLVLVSMTAVAACASDDSGDDTASTDPTTTADPTTGPTTTSAMTMTTDATEDSTSDTVDPDTGTTVDPTEDPTTSGTDPDTGTTDTGTGAGCEAYCAAFLVTCQDAEGAGLDGADPYADMDACMTACEGFTVDDGTPMGGNDLECRAYHLGVAAAMPGMGHCGHADIDGTGVCA